MNVIYLMISMAAGAAVSFLLARYYYGRMNSDLRIEVDKLTDLNFLILQRLEDAGLLKWNHDKKGNVVGLDLEFSDDATEDEPEVEDKIIH
ncbi:hypothetical protein ACFL4N_01505 [Thermodesulfobacteriota bacterium]